jgi:xanthine dehydrogenase YagT iron-sulfur-binding subunit
MERDRDEKDGSACQGLSRRGFIATLGTGAVAAAAAASAAGATAAAPQALPEAAELVKVTLRINGRRQSLMVEPRWSLLYVVRDLLGLTATKVGCERGECGACTLLVDGKSRYACMVLAVEAEGVEITTLEGLMKGEELGTVQQAFAEEDALQCGYCTPGQVMAVEALLRENPKPTLEDVRRGVSGNICRCGTYPFIFKAALRAAEKRSTT